MKKLFVGALLAASLLPMGVDAAAKDQAAAPVVSNAPVVTAPVAADDEYTMRSGDNLQLIVYGHEDLSTKLGTSYTPYVVRPDGNLSIPLIGDVQVTGKTVPAVVEEITRRLSEFIINPKVTINITKLGTTRVYVMGQVTRQGTYELEKSHNLIDAVGAAGGFTEKGLKTKVYLLRANQPDFVAKVNMMDLFTKNKKSANPELQEGDTIFISSNHKLTIANIFSMISNVASAVNNVDEVQQRHK